MTGQNTGLSLRAVIFFDSRKARGDMQLPKTPLHLRLIPRRRIRAYSITSSALSKTDCGKVIPKALAVFMLITSSNLVGWAIASHALMPR